MLIETAITRARALTPRKRIIAMIAPERQPGWREQLVLLAEEQLIVRPRNHGSAAALLVPLLRIAERDPQAIVTVVPADHQIADQEVIIRAMEAAIEGVQCHPERIVLLGIRPEEPDPSYSWIVPSTRTDGRPFLPVETFIDRPSRRFARILFKRGGLWNSSIFAATIETLFKVYQLCLPEVWSQFTHRGSRAERFRNDLEDPETRYPQELSSDVLGCCEQLLGVIPVAPCGWRDLSRAACARSDRRTGLASPQATLH